MKKTISIMTLSLLTVTTLASASPSDQMDFSTLNQSDSHVLFGTNNNNVITLEQNEMDETKGERWGFWRRIEREFHRTERHIQHGLGRVDNFIDRVFGIKHSNYSEGRARANRDNMNNNHGHSQVGYTWHFKRR